MNDAIEDEINKLDIFLAGKRQAMPPVVDLFQASILEAQETLNLFDPSASETMEGTLERIIALLLEVYTENDGYKRVIANGNPKDYYTDLQKEVIKRQAQFLRRAYVNALEVLSYIVLDGPRSN